VFLPLLRGYPDGMVRGEQRWSLDSSSREHTADVTFPVVKVDVCGEKAVHDTRRSRKRSGEDVIVSVCMYFYI